MDSSTGRVTCNIAGYTASVALHGGSHPSKPTILALHGFSGSGKDFQPLREALGQDRVNWICPDFMGHGESESPNVIDPYTLPAAMRLIDFARQLAPDPNKVLLLAYSMGGRIALHYLRHARPLPAILIGSSPGLEDPEARNDRRINDQKWFSLLDNSMEIFCTAWEDQPLIRPQTTLPEPFRGKLAERRRRNSPTGLKHSLLICGTGVLPSLWNHIKSVPPVTLIHGELDEKCKGIALLLAQANSGMTVCEVPKAGHSPHLESPTAVASTVGEILKTPYFN